MPRKTTFQRNPPGTPPVTEAVGESEAFLTFQALLSRAAAVDRPILILGERGTGKELAARRLHYLSSRWRAPMVTLNCAALTPALIETELFGHEKGAYTGAVNDRAGRFEAADGGTLFLDEIAAVPLEVQEKILRTVEYGTFERVGSSRVLETDVRIVGATNADILALSRKGLFKRDLLDRLSFDALVLPPLRDRGEDILLLADHFARRMAIELQREKPPAFSAKALDALLEYGWPGNIRELKNVVERAVYRTDTARIDTIEFSPFRSPFSAPASAPAAPETGAAHICPGTDPMTLPLKKALAELEIRMVQNALESARFNQKKAAERLGLTYDQFRGLLRKHGDHIER